MDWFYIPFIIDWNFGLLGIPLGLIWIVGVTNIYNFLDGVNGIATLQGMVAALAWSLFGWLINEPLLVVSNVILCGTLLAFLYYNWTPAKIFRSEEHTSELQSRGHLVCRLLLEKKKTSGYL